MLFQQQCKEEVVGFVDLWGCFVGRADKYTIYGTQPSGKGAAVFADEIIGAVDSGMGGITLIVGRNTV